MADRLGHPDLMGPLGMLCALLTTFDEGLLLGLKKVEGDIH
jgi:hypothetical protein